MKKVIGFCGSPKNNSNTEHLLLKVLEGAQNKGAETKWYDIKKLNIANCLGCAGCRRSGKCVIKDDMTELLKEITNSDAVVFASPIYMMQMNVYIKKFIERLWPLMKNDGHSMLKDGTKGLWLFTQGTEEPQAFKAYFDHNELMMGHFGFTPEKTFTVGNTRAKGDFEKQEKTVKQAIEIGTNLV